MNLDSIILFVQNIPALKPLYIDGLGLEVLEEHGSEWLLLKAGASNIGLHRIGEEYRKEEADQPEGIKNTKLCFEIETDIKQLREKLINMGTAMREIKTFDNYDFWLCDGEDAEGNVFQLKQRK